MSADEDIFASLGGSLMSGLLSDLNQTTAASGNTSNPNGDGNGNDDLDALASLERDLAGLTAANNNAQPQPPGITNTGGNTAMPTLSAASMVVAGLGAPTATAPASASAPPPPAAATTATTTTTTQISGDDAWALSLAKFSSLQGLADDFVKADAAKKATASTNNSSNPPSAPPSGGLQLPPGDLSSALVDTLFDDDDDDGNGNAGGGGGGYDLNEQVTLGSAAAGGIDLGAMRTRAVQQAKQAQQQAKQVQAAAQAANQAQAQQRPGGPQPPPPPPAAMMHPQQQMMMQQQQMMAAQQQAAQAAQQAMMSQHQQQAAAYARHMEQQAAVANMEQQRQLEYMARQRAREEKKMAAMLAKKGGMAPAKNEPQQQQPVAFLKKDFPTLGGGGGGGGGDASSSDGPNAAKDAVVTEEDGNEPLISAPPPAATNVSPSKAPTGIVGTDTIAPRHGHGHGAAGGQPGAPPIPAMAARLLFCNPTPSAPPINANNVRSYFMTPRDLCYVVHSMMRPLISLDAYNDDFYRWSYDDRRNRNLLVLGGNNPAAPTAQGKNLPNPVWKETKEKAQAIEDKYRGNVEKRAEKWSTKQQTLGKTVKVNVKRPKALLATTGALTTAMAADDEREERSEEDRQRASMWSARMAIDRGYVAYLDLLETRRLLQTSAGLEASVAERRAELTRDVEANVAKLHGSLGVTVSTAADGGDNGETQRTIEVDAAVLARTLGMPKGRMLLSRVLDDGVLPHSSACRVLPKALGAILATAVPAAAAGAPPRGEDRLVRSLTGLVQTAQPSLSPQDLIDCLVEFGTVHQTELRSKGAGPGDTVRNMLGTSGGQRARMELLHAILSRGGMVCGASGPDVAGAWKAKEAEFMSILSAMNS